MVEPWLSELTIEELPEPYQTVARKVGIETALILAREFGGSAIYFLKLDRLLVEARNKKIRSEFNGMNHRELAKKYNLTDVWIRMIVDAHDDPQMDLLEK